jgi:transposase-like protein
MDAILARKAEQLAREIASEAKTLDDFNGLMKLMMKSALERMLDTEADLHAEVTAWRTRQLDPVWPIVYLDGIPVHVRRASGRVLPQTMYVALAVNLQGRRELLGLWLSETEGAKFWSSCRTDLGNRGLRDIFIACNDGLTGFAAAYPDAKVQYPNEESALKLVYLAIHEASKKWTLPIPKWREALNHFTIIFEDRLRAMNRN